MSLQTVVLVPKVLTISALPGGTAHEVLRQMGKQYASKNVRVTFPEPWQDGGRIGKLEVTPHAYGLRFELVSGSRKGVVLTDDSVPYFSIKGKIDESEGLYILPVSRVQLRENNIKHISRNLLAVLGMCTQFTKDEAGRLYPDPHGLNLRPKKAPRPWARRRGAPLDAGHLVYMFE